MVNAVKKGNRAQNKARKYLEADGWITYVARRGFMGVQIDIFGMWDIIAYKDGHIRLIQVKSNICPRKEMDRLSTFMVDGEIVTTELWIYKDYSKHNPWIQVLGGIN